MSIPDYPALIVRATEYSGIADLPTNAPVLLSMAEAQLNRVLRTTDMEEGTTLAVSANGTASQPSDFAGFRHISDANGNQIKRVNISQIKDQSADGFYIQNGVFYFSQLYYSTTITLDYYASLLPLASNNTNWLLQQSPDIYLIAFVHQAYVREAMKMAANNPEVSASMSAAASAASNYLASLIDTYLERDATENFDRVEMEIGGYTP